MNKKNNKEIIKNKEILINDINEFIDYVSKDLPENKVHLFRGQRDVRWGLEAVVFRDNYNENKEKKIYEIITKYNFDEFSNNESFFDELIQMQHYGIPTRLLDWTYNPLIALYFVVAYEDDNDGYVFQNTIEKNEIYSFNSNKFKYLSKLFQADSEQNIISFNNDNDSTEIKRILKDALLSTNNTYFIDSVLRNNRIRAQQGCFSITIDNKKKFIEYVLNDIFYDFFREFQQKIPYDSPINKLLEVEKDKYIVIIRKLIKIYKNKEEKEEYKKAFSDYINQIKSSNIKFCEKYNIPNIEIELSKISENFSNFIIDKIKVLDENKQEIESNNLVRYRIKKEDKTKIKRQLKNIGITSTLVYPDIQGTIDHIKNIYK